MEDRLVIRPPFLPSEPVPELYKNFEIQRAELVTPACSIKRRTAVGRLAKYFQREFSYDFIQFLANEREQQLAYVFTTYSTASYRARERIATGAVCFVQREAWALQWAWMHPYFRNKGVIRNAWPSFRELFGQFEVEPPMSRAMKHLVNKYHLKNAEKSHAV